MGASGFAKIKMEKSPRVGKVGEPSAELTKMGWVMKSPRRENDGNVFTQTPVCEYEKLCGTDILGLEENHYNHDEFVFDKFKNTE